MRSALDQHDEARALRLIWNAVAEAGARKDIDALTLLAHAAEHVGPSGLALAEEVRATVEGLTQLSPRDRAFGKRVYQSALEEAEHRPRPEPLPTRASQYIGQCGDLTIYSDHISTPSGDVIIDEHVRAHVETAGTVAVTQRPTMTRMALGAALPGTALIPGFAFQKKKVHDYRELYFIVEHPDWARVVSLSAAYGDAARQIAAHLNRAARRVALDKQQYVAKQAEQLARYEQWRREKAGEPAPADPGPAAATSPVDQLRKLAELRDAGVVTPEEFEQQKTKLLDRL